MRGLLQVFGLIVAAGLMCLTNRPEFPDSSPAAAVTICDQVCTPTFEELRTIELPSVGLPPDIANVNATMPQPVEISDGEVRPIEPPPGLIKPVSRKVVAKKAEPAGHWETRYAGFRGRRSYQVWVPAAAGSCAAGGGSCSPGVSCSSAIANGSLPGYWSFGGCRSCR